MPAVEKIIMLGNSAVGKTSIIQQYIYNTLTPDHQATIGVDFFAKVVKVKDQSVRLQIWDTAGQEKFRSLIPSYIRSATVSVLVYDITNRESFEELENWYKMVIDLADTKFVVVGNKIDLESERVVTSDEAKKYADTHNAHYMEVSARTGNNIIELYQYIAENSIETKDTKPIPEPIPQPIPKPQDAQLSSCMC